MEEGMEKEQKMREIRKIAGLDDSETLKEEMDIDGDGSISMDELREFMKSKEVAKDRKKKLKAMGVFVGDKVVDLVVVSLAIVSMYFFGVSVL